MGGSDADRGGDPRVMTKGSGQKWGGRFGRWDGLSRNKRGRMFQKGGPPKGKETESPCF
jgi:hypothetical protein